MSPLPAPTGDELSQLVQDYPRRYCSICDTVVRKGFAPGPGGRPNASCPRCRSLERHRFLAVLLSVLDPLLQDVDVLLDIAPSPETSPLLERVGARTVVRLDLGADNRLVDVLGSVAQLPLPDESVDLMVCYHVLEHVPDDRAAIREMARVLSPGGLAIVQVPYRPHVPTDEDPDASPEERVRRFGQADHVRYYGFDFEDRLVENGLSIQRITPEAMLGPRMSTWLHLNPVEMVWLLRAREGATVPDDLVVADTSLTATFDAMLGEMTRLRGELRSARERIALLRERVGRLRGRVAALQDAPAPASDVRRVAAGARRRLRQGIRRGLSSLPGRPPG